MEQALVIVKNISEAQEGVLKAASALESAQAWEQANAKKEEIKDDQAKLKALEDEIAAYKHVFHEIADIAQKVAKQDWAGLASKALDFAVDQAIDALADARYGKDLADMQAKLAKAQEELKNLTFEALHKAVEAAHHGVSQSLIGLDKARQEFNNSIQELARLHSVASIRLEKSPSTKAVGIMLEQRAKQVHAINVASSKCEGYLRDSATRRKNIGTGRDKYRVIGSWLDKAAAADPAFVRSKPYAKMIEQTMLSNAVEFGNWDTHAQTVEAECNKALSWLADAGPSGPMVHFDRAVAVIKKGMIKKPI
jgi:vacuolar-type H+-ATPase subunit I/STV1